jgi:uncharacterized protein YdcH (DUF465 family)
MRAITLALIAVCIAVAFAQTKAVKPAKLVKPVVAAKNATVSNEKAAKYFKGLLQRNPRILRVADRVRQFKDMIKKISTDKKGDNKQVSTLKKVLRTLAAREEKRAVKDLQQLVKRRCTREQKKGRKGSKKGSRRGSRRGSRKGSKKASKKTVAKVNKVMSDSAFFKKLFSKVLPIIKNIGLTALKSGAIAAIA